MNSKQLVNTLYDISNERHANGFTLGDTPAGSKWRDTQSPNVNFDKVPLILVVASLSAGNLSGLPVNRTIMAVLR